MQHRFSFWGYKFSRWAFDCVFHQRCPGWLCVVNLQFTSLCKLCGTCITGVGIAEHWFCNINCSTLPGHLGFSAIDWPGYCCSMCTSSQAGSIHAHSWNMFTSTVEPSKTPRTVYIMLSHIWTGVTTFKLQFLPIHWGKRARCVTRGQVHQEASVQVQVIMVHRNCLLTLPFIWTTMSSTSSKAEWKHVCLCIAIAAVIQALTVAHPTLARNGNWL